MSKYLKYLLYVLKHKFYVFLEGKKLHVPLVQLIIHDWTKFSPTEFKPYAIWFYGCQDLDYDSPEYQQNKHNFKLAWQHHLHHNKHHWQYWILRNDDGTTVALPMPDRYVREMVADWSGVALTLKAPPAKSWYDVNKQKMLLHENTRKSVERFLENL